MDRRELLAWYDQELRIDIEYPGLRKDASPTLVRFIRPGSGMNFITYSRLADDEIDAAIAGQIAELAPLGQPFTWKIFAHDPPSPLADRLAAHGFVGDTPEPVMVLDLRECPPALLAPPAADVRRIDDPDGLDAITAIEEAVWGGSFAWLKPRLAAHLPIPGYLSVYAAWASPASHQEPIPACAGWIYFHQGSRFASLFGGSTLPGLRGRGLYTALLAQRAQEAIARGYRFLLIEPSPMSQPIVTKHGFQILTHLQDYEMLNEQ